MAARARPVALADVTWRPCRMILVPVPAERPAPRPIADLIACPLCRATLVEPCRTPAGNWIVHEVRLVSRRCPCGGLPREGSHFCGEQCRADARASTYRVREQRTPTRLRRRTAA